MLASTWQRSLNAAIRALKKDEEALRKELVDVRARIKDLESLSKADAPTNARARKAINRNRLSPAGREAISKAAKKRWAKYRSEKRKSGR